MNQPDAIILGGGVIGCALAEELAGRGKRVVVLDKGIIGAEASSAAAGILSAQMDVPEPGAFFDLCQASRRLYPRWVKRIERASGLSSDYRNSGVLYVAMNRSEETTMGRRIRWQIRQGLRVERLSPREVMKRNPAVDGRIRRGFFFANEAQVDNAALMHALAQACRRAGVELREETTVEKVESGKAELHTVRTDRGVFQAPVVVNCLGCWAGADNGFPVRLPVHPVRGQILVFDAPKRLFPYPVVGEKAYVIQRKDGRALVGSTLEAASYRKALTLAGIHSILCGIRHVTSAVNACALLTTWAGLRPGTPDQLPILGSTRIPGLFIAIGHYRHGILLAPITAKLMADLILSGRCSEPVGAFSLDRFCDL